MTDTAKIPTAKIPTAKIPTDWSAPDMQRRIAKRYAAERRFQALGAFSIILSAAFLAFLLIVMIGGGWGGFQRTVAPVEFDFPALTGGVQPDALMGDKAEATLTSMDLPSVVEVAAMDAFPKADEILAGSAWSEVRTALLDNPELVTQKAVINLPVASEYDAAYKGKGSKEAAAAVAALDGQLSSTFNWPFLTQSDATDPVAVGIWGALKGTLMTMVITLLIAFPIGVLSALYLEEYAPKNRWTDLIEVSINNLAAVPSIIFGLLGLVVFLEWFSMPRSAAIVGGLTLALMTMPVIVIAGRNAIKSVPPSIREAALGVGASPVQVVFHHVLPLALPGIMTGTIIGMARALGETAPLLMIGMRAFISDAPAGFSDAATVLPVQIYLWSDEVNASFVEKTNAAIIVLLIVLLSMNALAIYLRNRFETRW
jgi:phosphate transport system permease protein